MGKIDRPNQKKTKNKEEETKTKHASAQLVRSKSKIREGSPNGTRRTMEERIFETDEF